MIVVTGSFHDVSESQNYVLIWVAQLSCFFLIGPLLFVQSKYSFVLLGSFLKCNLYKKGCRLGMGDGRWVRDGCHMCV